MRGCGAACAFPPWYLLLVAVLGILSGCQSLRELERLAIRHHNALIEALGLVSPVLSARLLRRARATVPSEGRSMRVLGPTIHCSCSRVPGPMGSWSCLPIWRPVASP
jgi:hypothetical protein